jgi:hypothetical protein
VQLATDGVQLGRLILGRSVSQTLLLHNCSPLPIGWRVAAPETLPAALKLGALSGEIKAGQDASVTVTFTGVDKGVLNHALQIEVGHPQVLHIVMIAYNPVGL